MIRRWTRRWVGSVVVLGIVGIAVLVPFVHSGLYNVSATYPDKAPIAWVFSTTMDNSVRYHAKDIKAPTLDNPAMIRAGLRHYREDCVMCHGAPGVQIGEVGRGLNPSPPKLTEAAGEWKANELFWITKNGVRMTGMPAWGVIDSDEEIWQTVAFVRKLPSMTPADYRKMSRKIQ